VIRCSKSSVAQLTLPLERMHAAERVVRRSRSARAELTCPGYASHTSPSTLGGIDIGSFSIRTNQADIPQMTKDSATRLAELVLFRPPFCGAQGPFNEPDCSAECVDSDFVPLKTTSFVWPERMTAEHFTQALGQLAVEVPRSSERCRRIDSSGLLPRPSGMRHSDRGGQPSRRS
jgi:hypothetical protein